MKLAILIAAVVVAAANPAFAQNGGLFLFSDASFLDCALSDASVGPATIYVVHKFPTAASGVHFRIVASEGVTCVFSDADYGGALAFGWPTTGVGVSYGSCKNTDVLVATMTYSCLGTSTPCSYFSVEADPNYPSGQLVATDCANFPGTSPIAGAKLTVNPDGSCACSVPVQQNTWGAIKALYTVD